MNQVKSLIFALLISVSTVGQAQTYNTFKVDGLSALALRAGLAYERTMNKFFSVQLGAEYGSFADVTIPSTGVKDYNLVALNIVPEIRYYPFKYRKDAPFGFFIGEIFRYSRYKETYKGLIFPSNVPKEIYSTVLSFGLDAGYKFRIKRFSVEPLLGFGLINELHLGSGRNYIPIKERDGLLVYRNGVKDENGLWRLKLYIGYTLCKKCG